MLRPLGLAKLAMDPQASVVYFSMWLQYWTYEINTTEKIQCTASVLYPYYVLGDPFTMLTTINATLHCI